MDKDVTYRIATRDDVPVILGFIKELAAYEHLSDQVVASEEGLRDQMFDNARAEALLLTVDGVVAGMVLYFFNFSTFLGHAGLYIEDLFIMPAYRGRGYGRGLFQQVARIATEKGCSRVEWVCLDWNEPSIGFYRSLGARPLSGWTTFRLEGDALKHLGR